MAEQIFDDETIHAGLIKTGCDGAATIMKRPIRSRYSAQPIGRLSPTRERRPKTRSLAEDVGLIPQAFGSAPRASRQWRLSSE